SYFSMMRCPPLTVLVARALRLTMRARFRLDRRFGSAVFLLTVVSSRAATLVRAAASPSVPSDARAGRSENEGPVLARSRPADPSLRHARRPAASHGVLLPHAELLRREAPGLRPVRPVPRVSLLVHRRPPCCASSRARGRSKRRARTQKCSFAGNLRSAGECR